MKKSSEWLTRVAWKKTKGTNWRIQVEGHSLVWEKFSIIIRKQCHRQLENILNHSQHWRHWHDCSHGQRSTCTPRYRRFWSHRTKPPTVRCWELDFDRETRQPSGDVPGVGCDGHEAHTGIRWGLSSGTFGRSQKALPGFPPKPSCRRARAW